MIAVLIPDMPTSDEVLPMLRRIDSARWYSNGGPLLRELEDGLGYLTGAPVRCVSSGTAALELALRAMDLPPGSRVLVPAVTFVATVQAVLNAGHLPQIVDVEPDTWMLSPDAALEHAERLRCAAVIPVAAYGTAVPVGDWVRVARMLPVLIDAAGAIYDQPVADCIPVAYSLHATKALGCGEGGAVASRVPQYLERIEGLASFGPGGGNAKLDEYRAAVGLTALRRRPRGWRRPLHAAYGIALPRGLRLQAGRHQTRRTLMPVMLPAGMLAADAIEALAAAGVQARQWYAPLPHQREELMQWCRGPLPVADAVAQRVIGLPWHCEMRAADAMTVCDALRSIINVHTVAA